MNGTTNYMLCRMEDEKVDYADVLADAQRLGFAEADPTAGKSRVPSMLTTLFTLLMYHLMFLSLNFL